MHSEHLTPKEFDAHLQNGTLRLAFIGMSNAGKSYRSRVLQEEQDFLWYQVDEQIQKVLGLIGMGEISTWLGLPSSQRYAVREAEYLRLEDEFTRNAAMYTAGKNLVFDTTGSAVHLSDAALRVLHDNCLIVYMEIGEEGLTKMMEKFFTEPKPVAWQDFFTKEFGETEVDALRRCYPELLRARAERYQALAHMTVLASELRDTSGAQTLQIIRNHLER